jgi:hypothetical protein
MEVIKGINGNAWVHPSIYRLGDVALEIRQTSTPQGGVENVLYLTPDMARLFLGELQLAIVGAERHTDKSKTPLGKKLNDIRNLGIAKLESKVSQLQGVIAQAYQLAGMAGASDEVLDILAAAANVKDVGERNFLPIQEEDLEIGQEIAVLKSLVIELLRIIDDRLVGTDFHADLFNRPDVKEILQGEN